MGKPIPAKVIFKKGHHLFPFPNPFQLWPMAALPGDRWVMTGQIQKGRYVGGGFFPAGRARGCESSPWQRGPALFHRSHNPQVSMTSSYVQWWGHFYLAWGACPPYPPPHDPPFPYTTTSVPHPLSPVLVPRKRRGRGASPAWQGVWH